jgi:Mg2+/citrate symporter
VEIIALVVIGVLIPLSVMGYLYDEREKARLKRIEEEEELNEGITKTRK